MSQDDLDTFVFGNLNGGDEIAITRYKNGLCNRSAHTQSHKIDGKEYVHLLLLKNRGAVGVCAAIGQSAESNFKIGQATKVIMKLLGAGKMSSGHPT